VGRPYDGVSRATVHTLKAKLSVVTLVGFLVVALAVAGMIRVASEAESIAGSNPGEAARTYADLRDRLRFFLTAAGLVIGGAILTAGALQSALDGYASQEASPEIVLLYAGFLSLLLTVVYGPAFGSVRSAGEKLLDALAPLPTHDYPEWSAARERREELRSFLELDVGLLDSLKVGFAVPLASGLLTLLLPSGCYRPHGPVEGPGDSGQGTGAAMGSFGGPSGSGRVAARWPKASAHAAAPARAASTEAPAKKLHIAVSPAASRIASPEKGARANPNAPVAPNAPM
jgi:hypothetical protein